MYSLQNCLQSHACICFLDRCLKIFIIFTAWYWYKSPNKWKQYLMDPPRTLATLWSSPEVRIVKAGLSTCFYVFIGTGKWMKISFWKFQCHTMNFCGPLTMTCYTSFRIMPPTYHLVSVHCWWYPWEQEWSLSVAIHSLAFYTVQQIELAQT